MKARIFIVLLGFCTALALTDGTAFAGDDPPRPSEETDELILAEPAVPASDLGDLSGGTDIDDININWASNVTNINGQVGDHVKTGGIANNTLSNVNGINSLMYNTGNNVSFSSAMQFNINLQ